MYTASDNLPLLNIFQWSTPDNPNPRLSQPVGKTDTTLYWSSIPKDYQGDAITGDFIMNCKNNKGYTEQIYIPAGKVHANGLGADDVIRGVRLNGLDYTTGDSNLAVDLPSDAPIGCVVSPVHAYLWVRAIQGGVATGGNQIRIGDLTEADQKIAFANDHTVFPSVYWDDSLKRVRLTWGDDAPSAGDLDGVGIPVLTTTERDALTWGANGALIVNITTGRYQVRLSSGWHDVGTATGGDKLVGVTSADSSPSYLNDKITVDTGIKKTVVNAGANEKLKIEVDLADTDVFVDSSSGSSDDGKVPLLNSEGKLDDDFINPSHLIFGTGKNGALTTSGDITLSADKFYTNLTVSSGDTINTNGFRLFVNGTLTNNGTIDNSASDGGDGANGVSGSGGNGGAGGIGGKGNSLPSGKTGATGGKGGEQVQGNNGTAGTPTFLCMGTNNGSTGGRGGGSTAGNFGASGGAAGASNNTRKNQLGQGITEYSLCDPDGTRFEISGNSGGGGGGQGQTSSYGGGGGGAGGVGGFIAIYAKKIINNGDIKVKGGDGGDGGNGHFNAGGGGGGAGGRGGTILLVYISKSGSGIYSYNGGAGGTAGTGGKNNGVNGSVMSITNRYQKAKKKNPSLKFGGTTITKI